MTAHFVVICLDRPGAGALRTEVRPRHREYLRASGNVRVRAAGPLLDDSGQAMSGTFELVEAPSRSDVQAFVAADPYSQAGLFETVSIWRLHWTLGNPDLPGA